MPDNKRSKKKYKGRLTKPRTGKFLSGKSKITCRNADPAEKFKVTFEHANDIIAFVDKKGNIIDVNKRVKNILGYRVDEIKGQNLFKLFILDRQYLPRVQKLFRSVVKKGKLSTANGKKVNILEYELRHKNGKKVMVEASTRIVKMKNKRECFLTVVRDVTDRKRAELALMETSERLKKFMESANEGFVLLDSDLNITEANEYILNEFGVSRKDAIGSNILDWSYGVWESGRYDRYKKVIETGKPISLDVVAPPRFGNRHLFFKLFKVGSGLGMVIRDITKERSMERALQESEHRFRTLYEAIHAGVIVHTADGQVTHINRVACRYLGLTEEEIKEGTTIDHLFRLYDKDDNPIPKTRYPSMVTIKISKPIHNAIRGFRAAGSDKTRWLFINAEPIFDPETKKVDEVIITFFDITERKQIEQALKESEERYRHMFEHCPVGVGISGLDGQVVAGNKVMLNITGYTMEDYKKVNLADTYENIEERHELLQMLEQKGSVINFPARLKRKDGSVYDALLSIARITIQGKEYFHTICQVVAPQE